MDMVRQLPGSHFPRPPPPHISPFPHHPPAPPSPQGTEEGAPLPDALMAGSCLGAITQEPDFLAAWAGAECRLAEARMLQNQSGSGGGGRAGGGGEGGGGSQREFNPPEFAEHAVDAITALVARSRHAPSAHDQAVRMMRHGGGLRRGCPVAQNTQHQGCT